MSSALAGTSPRLPASDRAARLALAGFALAWFVVVGASATTTLYPIVLSDECTYLLTALFGYDPANFARWGVVPQIPNHLHYAIYGQFGSTEIYRNAKLLNAALVAATALPVWLLARRYLSPWAAAAFAALTVALPSCTFARYFMPETLFVFGFWWIAWAVLATADRRWGGWAVGVGLGVLALVKPHAVGLAAGIALYYLANPGRRVDRALAAAGVVASFLIMRAAVAFLLTGQFDLSLSGPAYKGALVVSRLDLPALAVNGLGHLAAVFLLVGAPLVVIVHALVLRPLESHGPKLRRLMLLAVCILAALLAMAVWYSHGAHLIDPEGERITRLHGRYYAYALPLAVLAYVALVVANRDEATHGSRVTSSTRSPTVATLGIGLVVLAWAVVTFGYEVGAIDYAELATLARWPNGLIVIGAGMTVAFAAYVSARRWQSGGARAEAGDGRAAPRIPEAAAWSWLPVAWWGAVMVTTSAFLLAGPLLGKWFYPMPIDTAMMTDPTLRSLQRRDDGLIVGPHTTRVDIYRAMFHLASRSRGMMVAPGTTLSPAAIPPDVNWIVLMPGADYAGPGKRGSAGPVTYVVLR